MTAMREDYRRAEGPGSMFHRACALAADERDAAGKKLRNEIRFTKQETERAMTALDNGEPLQENGLLQAGYRIATAVSEYRTREQIARELCQFAGIEEM